MSKASALTDEQARALAAASTPAFSPSTPYPGSANKPWEGICLQCGEPWSPRLGNLTRHEDDRSVVCFKCTRANQRRRPAVCTVAGCETLEEFPRKGMCQKHYIRWKTHGDPQYVRPIADGCSIEACDKPHYGNGYCAMHNARVRKYGEPGGAEPMWRPREGQCSVEECTSEQRTRGFCSMHYQRVLKYGDPLFVAPRGLNRKYPPTCCMPDCERAHKARGYCDMHLKRLNKHGDPETLGSNRKFKPGEPCRIADCDSPILARGFCIKHYARWRDHGDPTREPPRVEGCLLPDCDGEHYGRGWCQVHYHRWKTQGDPLWEPPPRIDEAQLFEIVFAVGFIPHGSYPGSVDAPWPGTCETCKDEASPRLRTILGGAQPMCACVRARVGQARTNASRERCLATLQSEEYMLRGFEMRNRAFDGQNLSWVLFTCPLGHVGEMSVNNWNSGKRCSTCRPGGYVSESPGAF